MKDSHPLETWYEDWNADVGVITTRQLTDANRRVRNLLLYSPASELEADVIGYTPHASQQANVLVCRMGVNKGVICGLTTTNMDETKPSTVGSTTRNIDHTVVYRADALGGDSGGPVYVWTLPYPYSRYKATLWGTHVHSDGGAWSEDKFGWYSPIDRGINTLENHYPGLSLSPCATATCGLPDPID